MCVLDFCSDFMHLGILFSPEFELSDAQQEHALAIEQLVPRLSALRIELSPGYMSEACFWKIYFVLVHPRLNKHDAELLSTPQVCSFLFSTDTKFSFLGLSCYCSCSCYFILFYFHCLIMWLLLVFTPHKVLAQGFFKCAKFSYAIWDICENLAHKGFIKCISPCL